MTPGQRQYDLALAMSMRNLAKQVASRSGKVADALNTGADRIEALLSQIPVEQPASTPDQMSHF